LKPDSTGVLGNTDRYWIGIRKLVALRPSRSKAKGAALEVVMPSRNEAARRARARLELESMPTSDASLSELQEEAEDYLREAKRRDPSEPDQLLSTVVDAMARKYFHQAIRKQRRTG
jgi:hypothetical protein